MYTRKKIQRRILIHSRRILSLIIVFFLLFYSYVSANTSCVCCTGSIKKNNSHKKIESCCSSKTGENQHHNCPESDVEKSDHDCNSCSESCEGHLVCGDNNYHIDIIPIYELNIQKLLSKYFLTSHSFQTDNTAQSIDYLFVFKELNNHLDKIPLTIPLRI